MVLFPNFYFIAMLSLQVRVHCGCLATSQLLDWGVFSAFMTLLTTYIYRGC